MFLCGICLDEDKRGKIYQCDKGHGWCEDCYSRHVDEQRRRGESPSCPLCRDKLAKRPVRSRMIEEAIENKRRRIIAEVVEAQHAADQLEVVSALERADQNEQALDAAMVAKALAAANANEEKQEQAAVLKAIAEADAQEEKWFDLNSDTSDDEADN